jgi:hypothetical protein
MALRKEELLSDLNLIKDNSIDIVNVKGDTTMILLPFTLPFYTINGVNTSKHLDHRFNNYFLSLDLYKIAGLKEDRWILDNKAFYLRNTYVPKNVPKDLLGRNIFSFNHEDDFLLEEILNGEYSHNLNISKLSIILIMGLEVIYMNDKYVPKELNCKPKLYAVQKRFFDGKLKQLTQAAFEDMSDMYLNRFASIYNPYILYLMMSHNISKMAGVSFNNVLGIDMWEMRDSIADGKTSTAYHKSLIMESYKHLIGYDLIENLNICSRDDFRDILEVLI